VYGKEEGRGRRKKKGGKSEKYVDKERRGGRGKKNGGEERGKREMDKRGEVREAEDER